MRQNIMRNRILSRLMGRFVLSIALAAGVTALAAAKGDPPIRPGEAASPSSGDRIQSVQPADAVTLLARKPGSPDLRLTSDREAVEVLLANTHGAGEPAPSRPPDLELILFESGSRGGARVFGYWEQEAVWGEEDASGAFACRPAKGVSEVLAAMNPGTAHAGVTPRVVETHGLPASDGGGARQIGALEMFASRIFRGRVVGVVECYYSSRPGGLRGRQHTSYLLEAHEQLKGSGPRYVRLVWTGGYLDGGEESRRTPLLPIGGDYVFFLRPWYRTHFDDEDRPWLEDRGEYFIVAKAWAGMVGFGLLRIQNGVVLPPFEYVEQEWARLVAHGEPFPVMNRFGEHPFPAWGLTWPEYRRHYRLNTVER
jgi:hypothetical protein